MSTAKHSKRPDQQHLMAWTVWLSLQSCFPSRTASSRRRMNGCRFSWQSPSISPSEPDCDLHSGWSARPADPQSLYRSQRCCPRPLNSPRQLAWHLFCQPAVCAIRQCRNAVHRAGIVLSDFRPSASGRTNPSNLCFWRRRLLAVIIVKPAELENHLLVNVIPVISLVLYRSEPQSAAMPPPCQIALTGRCLCRYRPQRCFSCLSTVDGGHGSTTNRPDLAMFVTAPTIAALIVKISPLIIGAGRLTPAANLLRSAISKLSVPAASACSSLPRCRHGYNTRDAFRC